jgi:hypothetical protein
MANRTERNHSSITAWRFAFRSRDYILRSLLTRDRANPRAAFRMLVSIALLTVGLLLSAASYSAQYTASGTIVAFRNHTLSYPLAAIQGFSILQLSTAFSNGCSWVFLTAADKNALAVILSAKALGTSIVIYYDNAIGAPWGDPTTCAVIAVDSY